MSDEIPTSPGFPAAEEAPSAPQQPVSIFSLLKGLVTHKASDLHVKVGRPPLYRINGKLLPAKLPALSLEDVKKLAYSTMTNKQIKAFEENLQVDFGYLVPGLARFRANVFTQKGTPAFVIRVVPLEVPEIDALHLPPVVQELALKPRGLILVTGATGSGKSTTLAAMVEHINRKLRAHVVTIEDPIEYIFEDKRCTISQREVGVDATSMQSALRGALRQDPDIIMIGEMRDFATIQTAMTAAETGHLVLSTMHTSTAIQAIDRILDSFPADSKNQLRVQLANCLLGVVTQRLVRRADGNGRTVACEILTKSPTVEKLLLDNRVTEIEEVMENSNLLYKMQSMNQALEALITSGTISREEGLAHSDKKEELILKLSGMVQQGRQGADAAQILGQIREQPGTQHIDVGGEMVTGQQQTATSGIKLDDPKGETAKKESARKLSEFFKKRGA